MKLQNLLKYLFIPGLILGTAGLVIKFTSQSQQALAIGLLTGSSIILILWLAYVLKISQGFWKKRSTQVGTNALISTTSVVIILALVNFLAVRYSLRLDLTENQLFTLSPQSQEVVQALDKPLKVWIFDREPNSRDKELLNSYRRYNSLFEFEYIDPDQNLGIAQKFGVKAIGDVYIEYGDKRQLAQNLMAFSQREPLSEAKITNGIEKIQREKIPKVYILQGHGEHPLDNSPEGFSEAVSSLENKGYKVEPLNLAQTANFPEDADAIVIAGPKRELLPKEVEVLQKYSGQGGNLLVLVDPMINSGLNSFLKEWGIVLSERVIVDGSGAGNLIGLGPLDTIVTTYGNHPITEEFKNGISIYPLAQPLETNQTKDVFATALIVTSEQTWAESDLDSEQVSFDEKQDIRGPLDLGVALARSFPEAESEAAEKPQEAKMVVIGNSIFATNALFNQQLNGDVFLNSVQWLASEDQQPLSIRPKQSENRRIVLSKLQAAAIFWLSIVGFPLIGFLLAGITWLRRS